MEKGLVCPICGAPTRVYMGNARKDRLCGKHADELKAGKIGLVELEEDEDSPWANFWNKYIFEDTKTHAILNEDINEIPDSLREYWIYAKKDNKQKTVKKENPSASSARTSCVVCGSPTKKGYMQCKDCYYETLNYIDGLDKNSRINEFRDHYYNLKDAIFRMKNFEYVQSNCNKLIAIAMQNEATNSDSSLTDKMEKDVERLIENKKPKDNAPEAAPVPTETTEKDEKKSNIYATVDGHMVKSNMEQVIDDILWNAGILHAYEQPISEFVYERKKCDWFIPIIGSEQGIYIEYWGMKTHKYLEDRKEKEDLYKKYNVPYIGIEKDDPKDTHSFRSSLLQELQRKAIETYGFMPKWKK